LSSYPYKAEFDAVLDEITRAVRKFSLYPTDCIHASAVVSEECGELVRACLQWTYEGGNITDVRKEAIHTAAMAIRFLANLETMENERSKPYEN
jgi:hypothetical protein